jgi:HK97 family phage major capsid protein
MTKAFIQFPHKRVNYAPKIQSRRLGLHSFRNVAYKSDGDTDDEAAQKAFLLKVKEETANVLKERGIDLKEGESIQKLMEDTFKTLSVNQRTAYDDDKAKLEGTIRAIAGELEKIKTRNVGSDKPVNPLQEQLENVMPEIQKRFGNKDDKREIMLNVRAAAVMATTNTINETTNSIPVDLVEGMSIEAFVAKRRGVQFINEIASVTTVAQIDQFKSWLEEGSEQGAFAIVAEGGLKPLVSYDLVRNYSTYKKVAGKYVVTEEFQKFRNNAYNIIRGLIQDKLVRDYTALLVTDLNAAAAAYAGTALDDTIVAPNDYDAIAAAASQVMALNFYPDVIVINPADAWRIRLTKDANGNYIFPVATDGGVTSMLGLRVFQSTYQTAGSFTIGEAGLFKIEQEPVTVRMGYGVTVTGASPVTAVVSDFDNNQFRVIVETYFHDFLPTPYAGSFVKTTFATVKAALLKP